MERNCTSGHSLYQFLFLVLGGGLSIYQGILHISHAEPLGNPAWNYAVLGFSFIFDGGSFVIALKGFNEARRGQAFWPAVIKSKDPSSFLVLFEDGAAVLGLIIVFILMVCSHTFNLPFLDGVASILVGLLLVFSSIILARESRSLLMGEGIAPETQQKIKTLAESDAAVLKVTNILSTYEAPDEVVLMLIVIFKPDLDTGEITDAIERIRKAIKQKFVLIEFVLIQPQASLIAKK